MQYKMIATDLDDTLLDDNSNVSVRNREAILAAVEKGVKFVIATGRMFRTSVGYLADIGLDGDSHIINYHGALLKRAKSGETLLHRPLLNSMAIEIADEAQEKECHVSLFIDDNLYISGENEYSRYYQSLAKIELEEVGDLSLYLSRTKSDPSKISIIRWDGKLDDVEAGLKKSFGSKLSILQSRPYFLEITDRQATKGQTLGWLAESEGIKAEEIIAFGDGHNDLDMLEYAGLGVAVANARPELIAAADLVTSSNMEDGVAEVIEKYILS